MMKYSGLGMIVLLAMVAIGCANQGSGKKKAAADSKITKVTAADLVVNKANTPTAIATDAGLASVVAELADIYLKRSATQYDDLMSDNGCLMASDFNGWINGDLVASTVQYCTELKNLGYTADCAQAQYNASALVTHMKEILVNCSTNGDLVQAKYISDFFLSDLSDYRMHLGLPLSY